MSEIIPFPKVPEIEMPSDSSEGVSVLIGDIRKKMMENENYTEEVGRDFRLINS